MKPLIVLVALCALAAALLATRAHADVLDKTLNPPRGLSDIDDHKGPPVPSASIADGTYYEGGNQPYPIFGPADKAALNATPSWRQLPPVEYDRPYDGTLTVLGAGNQEQTQAACGWPRPVLACSYHSGRECTIIHAREDYIVQFKTTLNIVMRHEIGHCNGWPGDHPGAR
jgi:hypothetical protein